MASIPPNEIPAYYQGLMRGFCDQQLAIMLEQYRHKYSPTDEQLAEYKRSITPTVLEMARAYADRVMMRLAVNKAP